MLYCKKFETQIPLISFERYCNLWKASVRLERISWKENVNVPLVRFVNFRLGIVRLLSPLASKNKLSYRWPNQSVHCVFLPSTATSLKQDPNSHESQVLKLYFARVPWKTPKRVNVPCAYCKNFKATNKWWEHLPKHTRGEDWGEEGIATWGGTRWWTWNIFWGVKNSGMSIP